MKIPILTLFLISLLSGFSYADNSQLESYISHYNYDSRLEMKANSTTALDLLEDGKAVLVDIRFKEEQQAWGH
jgi:hypothetical protein